MEDPIVIFNGKQTFSSDSEEDAVIIELTQEINEALDQAFAPEKLKLNSTDYPEKPNPTQEISTGTRLLLKMLIKLLMEQGEKCVYCLAEPVNIKG